MLWIMINYQPQLVSRVSSINSNHSVSGLWSTPLESRSCSICWALRGGFHFRCGNFLTFQHPWPTPWKVYQGPNVKPLKVIRIRQYRKASSQLFSWEKHRFIWWLPWLPHCKLIRGKLQKLPQKFPPKKCVDPVAVWSPINRVFLFFQASPPHHRRRELPGEVKGCCDGVSVFWLCFCKDPWSWMVGWQSQ